MESWTVCDRMPWKSSASLTLLRHMLLIPSVRDCLAVCESYRSLLWNVCVHEKIVAAEGGRSASYRVNLVGSPSFTPIFWLVSRYAHCWVMFASSIRLLFTFSLFEYHCLRLVFSSAYQSFIKNRFSSFNFSFPFMPYKLPRFLYLKCHKLPYALFFCKT